MKTRLLLLVCLLACWTVAGYAAGDKKRSGDSIDVVVLREIGRAETVRLTMAELKEFVEAAL